MRSILGNCDIDKIVAIIVIFVAAESIQIMISVYLDGEEEKF